MRLPWVARERLDAVQRLLDIAHAEVRHERTIADTRYDELLAKYHALAQPVLPVMAAPVERVPIEASPITKVIRDEAQGDTRLAAWLRKRAQALKAEHPDWEDSQVAAELARWETTETEATA